MSASNSSVPRLGPAWRSGGGRGFQPPPAVPDAVKSNAIGSVKLGAVREVKERSGSHVSSGVKNPYSLLEEDEENDSQHLATHSASTASSVTVATTAAVPVNGGRFANLTGGSANSNANMSSSPPLFSRSASSGAKAGGGRSLADLAAGLGGGSGYGTGGGERGVLSRGSSFGHDTRSRFSEVGRNTGHGDISNAAGSASEKVIRYTKEKLLSLRPAPKQEEELPEILKHLEGTVVVSNQAQDPVCWDDFNPDEIWGQISRERRSSGSTLSKISAESKGTGGAGGVGDRLRDLYVSDGSEKGKTRSAGSVTTGGGGRWQRGLSLPEDARSGSGGGRLGLSRNDIEAESADDLWDDPSSSKAGTGAAADFSQFSVSLDDDSFPRRKSGHSESFELNDISKATAVFEAELHGDKKENGDNQPLHSCTHVVDPSRPLASSGTTIQSGSGDHVNVFEDFGDDLSTEEATAQSVKEDEDLPIKSANAISASSRLMKMIGVLESANPPGRDEETTEVENKPQEIAQPEPESIKLASVPSNPWGSSISIPSNPWGDQTSSNKIHRLHEGGLRALSIDSFSNSQLREAEAAAQRQREEELHQRQQEAEEKKRWAEIQAKQKAEIQAQQQRQQQQNQVELVLMERISHILENSWGQSDLVSILSNLHSDDSRVMAILSNLDALRALISRHSQRIALVRDAAMGTEMAALLLTNQQWQMQQARLARQQQAQVQAREQELQRRRLLEEQQRQQQESIARAQAQEREVQERKILQQHIVIRDAPWFYADPQGNIQGPFGGVEMREWLEAGYFKGDLPISQNNTGPFRTLSTFFPDPSTAFQPRVDETSLRAEGQRRQAEVAAAEEMKLRGNNEMIARAEAQQRELEIRTRLKAEDEIQIKAEEKVAKVSVKEESKKLAQESNQNNQSVQLKMMLGLDGSSSVVGQSPSDQPDKKQTKINTPQKQMPSAHGSSPAPEVTPISTPAWGDASASIVGRKKSMSEIQQEEAKIAAKRALEQGGNQRTGGGWANIAASGSSLWNGSAIKNPTPSVVTPNLAVIAGVGSVQRINNSAQMELMKHANTSHESKQTQHENPSPSKDAIDNFGANGKLTPALESWCKTQMQKINNSDDLTLVSFCMTLSDPVEIRQYLTAYLGSTTEVNNFATEFIKKKGGDNDHQQGWESAGGPKKGRKKKVGK